jgi:hypothetical protein
MSLESAPQIDSDDFGLGPHASTDKVDGAALLDEVRETITRYVVLPSDESTIAVTLWVVATHGVDRFDHATRLAIHSPVKRCGKSRLFEVIAGLVHEPLQTTNVSVPALFRMIEAAGDRPPTILLDEADQIFGSAKKDEQSAALVAVLNNGFRRGSPTIRCVGPTHAVTAFSTFAFVAVAGIGRLPGTIEDRAVNITMRRHLPDEQVAKFRLRTDLVRLQKLREVVGLWVSGITVEVDEVQVPDELEDRASDAWEPLLAIADAAGGEWPRWAREAAVSLSRQAAEDDSDQSAEVRLLTDMRTVFGTSEFLSTKSILAQLRSIEDAPWADLPLSSRGLSMRLSTFGVKPRRNAAGTARGYRAADFVDPFSRYLPSEPSDASDTQSEQGRCSDGSELSDGSNRQSGTVRQRETAGQESFLTELTLLTDIVPTAEVACGRQQ